MIGIHSLEDESFRRHLIAQIIPPLVWIEVYVYVFNDVVWSYNIARHCIVSKVDSGGIAHC